MITETYEALLKLRSEAGLTQEEVAAEIGIERATYSRYESGARKLSALALMKLAHLYGVSPEYIMIMDEPDAPDEFERALVASARRLNVEGRRQLEKQLNYLLGDAEYTKRDTRSAI